MKRILHARDGKKKLNYSCLLQIDVIMTLFSFSSMMLLFYCSFDYFKILSISPSRPPAWLFSFSFYVWPTDKLLFLWNDYIFLRWREKYILNYFLNDCTFIEVSNMVSFFLFFLLGNLFFCTFVCLLSRNEGRQVFCLREVVIFASDREIQPFVTNATTWWLFSFPFVANTSSKAFLLFRKPIFTFIFVVFLFLLSTHLLWIFWFRFRYL